MVTRQKPTFSPTHFFDRDIQWLEFNHRVLHEALDSRTALLERIKFLGIFTSNLDEFFMKRVGFYLQQVAFENRGGNLPGRDPRTRLEEIKTKVYELYQLQSKAFKTEILPALEKRGIFLLDWSQLNSKQQDYASTYFRRQVFPVLTPLAVDPGHPFPFISNLSTSLAVTVRIPHRKERLFSRTKIPNSLPQLVRLNRKEETTEYHFVRLIDIVRHNLDRLFPNMDIEEVMAFRVTRNADIEWDEEGADDLLELISKELRQRRFGEVVRLECETSGTQWLKDLLLEEFEISGQALFEIDGEIDYGRLKALADLNAPELKEPSWQPVTPAPLNDKTASVFHLIRSGDILLHHPYESFDGSVERFIREAALDPHVQAIKMTLYRTGDNSPFISLLIEAAERGKQVVCLIELKARFDEEQNIFWARKLEDAGVHVVYGVVGYKTHAKMTLVVREEEGSMRCYAHLGTGNYNKMTARLYEDFGLLTCDPRLTNEVVELFNYLTGRSLKADYEHLLVAPISMKSQFLEMIAKEGDEAEAGRPARIVAKMNSLEDTQIIEALYKASCQGVQIDLIVRGFCCLRPQVPGLSENIRVSSIVGRFLEHSRIYYFQHQASDPSDGTFYLGSADWMFRNLQKRVELVFPVYDKALKEGIWHFLNVELSDQRQRWTMQNDGSYVQFQADSPSSPGTHQTMMQLFSNSQSAQDKLAELPRPAVREDS